MLTGLRALQRGGHRLVVSSQYVAIRRHSSTQHQRPGIQEQPAITPPIEQPGASTDGEIDFEALAAAERKLAKIDRRPFHERGSQHIPFTAGHPLWNSEMLTNLNMTNILQLRSPHEYKEYKNIKEIPSVKRLSETDRIENPWGSHQRRRPYLDTAQVEFPIVPESAESATSLVSSVLTHDGTCKRFEMNRTEAMNALDLKFTTEIRRMFQHLDLSPGVITFMAHTVTAGTMFCPGSDLRALLKAGRGSRYVREFYHGVYTLASVIRTVKKPAFVVCDGPIFGNASAFLAGQFPTTTLSSVFAVPDVLIGFFPDAGIIHKLAPLNEMGRYIALTGRRINYADIHKLKLAKFHMDTAQDAVGIQTSLGGLVHDDVYRIMTMLNNMPIEAPNTDMNTLDHVEHLVNRVFKKKTIQLMKTELKKIMEEDEGSVNGKGAREWAARTLNRMNMASPVSLLVTLEYLNIVNRERLSYEDCLTMDFRLSQRFAETDDYWKGLQMACEKNSSATWSYKSVDDVPADYVYSFFKPFADPRLEFRPIISRPEEDGLDWHAYYRNFTSEMTVPAQRPRIANPDGGISLSRVLPDPAELTAEELADIPSYSDLERKLDDWIIVCYKLDFAIRHESQSGLVPGLVAEFQADILEDCFVEFRKFVNKSSDASGIWLDRAADVLGSISGIMERVSTSAKLEDWLAVARDLIPIIASNLQMFAIMVRPAARRDVLIQFDEENIELGIEAYNRGLVEDVDYYSV